MGRWLLRYGPSAAFYIFALAAQMSGLTNTVAALLLAAIATVLLLFPGWHHTRVWRKAGGRVEPIHLIWIGMIGTIISVVCLGIGVIWQTQRPVASDGDKPAYVAKTENGAPRDMALLLKQAIFNFLAKHGHAGS